MSSRLPLVLTTLILAGCAASNKHVAEQSDFYAAKVAALSHMIREFGPPDGCCIAISDQEEDRLVPDLSALAAPVLRATQVTMDNGYGTYSDPQTGGQVVLLSAKIKSIDDRTATLEVELDAGPEGGNWFTLILRKQDSGWIVVSAVLDATS